MKGIKILLSTQYEQGNNNASPGSSLPLIIFADFLRNYFGFNAVLYDPIFNSSKYLSGSNLVFVDSVKLDEYDFIVNPLFYISSVKLFNIKIGMDNRDVLDNFLALIGGKFFQAVPMFGNQSIFAKSSVKELSIPYVYIIDWLVRWNYKVKFINSFSSSDLKFLEQENSLNKYALHLRPIHWKKIKNSLKDQKYRDFILKLSEKILTSKNNTLYIYGQEAVNSQVYLDLRGLGAIDLEDRVPNVIEKSLFLSQVNYFLSGINGFTTFCSYLSWSKNTLANHYIINDRNLEDEKLMLSYPRYLEPLIQEKNILRNSYFYSKQMNYPRDSILQEEFTSSPRRNPSFSLEVESQEVKKDVIYIYYIDKSVSNYFGNDVDNYIIKYIFRLLTQALPGVTFQLVKNYDDFILIDRSKLLNSQHVVTHFKLNNFKSRKKNKNLLEPNLPESTKSIYRQLNPSNITYLDLFQLIFYHSRLRQLRKRKAIKANLNKSVILVKEKEQINQKFAYYISKIGKTIDDVYTKANLVIYFLKVYGIKELFKKIKYSKQKKRYINEDKNIELFYFSNNLLLEGISEKIGFFQLRRLSRNSNVFVTSSRLYFLLNMLGINSKLLRGIDENESNVIFPKNDFIFQNHRDVKFDELVDHLSLNNSEFQGMIKRGIF